MTEKEIITEIERYLADTSYNYAVMIDGDWGCGKRVYSLYSRTAPTPHENEVMATIE